MVTQSQLQSIFNQLGNIRVVGGLSSSGSASSSSASGSASGSASSINPLEYSMFFQHKCVRTIWDEYHGLNAYTTEAFTGGIEYLETSRKSWRQKMTQSQTKYLSRMRYVVKFIREKVGEMDSPSSSECDRVIDIIDQQLTDKRIYAISSIERALKQGVITFTI